MSWVVVVASTEPLGSKIVGTFRTQADAADFAHDHYWAVAPGQPRVAAFTAELVPPAKAVTR